VKSAYWFAALTCLVLGVCAASPITGNAVWTGMATAHFALFTTNKRDDGQVILQRLAMARLFYQQTGWASHDLKEPLDILAFGSGKEYDSYRINPQAFAFYQPTREGNFVVMRSLEPEHYSVVVHEYAHFVVSQSELKLPLWLNEGLADVFSTMEGQSTEVMVGAPPPGREDTLSRQRWMDWGTLTAVDEHSAYYNQADKMLVFYAQSWALVHVLALDPAYTGKFKLFINAISGGTATADALPAIYHKTLAQMASEVEQDVKGNKLGTRLIPVDVRSGALNTAEVADAQEEAEIDLAQVLASYGPTLNEAKAQLAALAARYPDDPRCEEVLGFLALQAGAENDAEQHFSRAVGAHSKDPEVLAALAHLKMASGGSSEEAVDLLQRALAVNKADYNALIQLGFAAANSKRFGLAVETLEKLGTPRPEHAYSVAYTMSFCLLSLHQGNRARLYAEQARKIASSSSDKEQVAGLLNYIDQVVPGEVETK
jgi:Flp pilus assembly protein TadD